MINISKLEVKHTNANGEIVLRKTLNHVDSFFKL